MYLKYFNKSVDCSLTDFYVDVDFAQILYVDFRQTCKNCVESKQTQNPPGPLPPIEY